jgi:NAD(P)-dependent dehydrogenase (short-subunit alcohol dehydrogenase family)
MHTLGKIAQPEEIANAVVWLLSDKTSLGYALIVDSGMISR